MSTSLLRPIRRIRLHVAAAVAVLAVLPACTPVTPIGVDASSVVFLTETAPATFHMEALYKGNVVADAAGCLRLAGTGDQHTVVWPFGFELRPHNSGANVVDAQGRVIGEIGGAFTVGGGEVPALHDGIALSEEQKAVAREKCPGRYWIVGDVP
jgi:hypothetical protein